MGMTLNSNTTLAYAITAILGGTSGLAYADTPASGTSGGSDEIQPITGTGQRRTENMQNVPITIQALTAETLTQLNVSTFDEFVRYLPNVTAASNGPAQGNIYMRGLSTGGSGNQGVGAVGAVPNVAIYLDEQSGQVPGRNLDIYAADLERIEVLEGPQGTLFGAGAQAGVLRYITNKPKLNTTEGGVEASYSTTAHGDPSDSVQAYINIPLIEDTLAVRAVIYDDARGGYIHNIPGTFARSGTDLGIVDYFGGSRNGNTVTTPGVVPAGSETVNNSALVNSAYNPTVYQGARVSGLYKFNDDWNLLLEQSYQSMQANGVFGYELALGCLKVQQYNPSSDNDRFEDTAWTLNGKIDALKVVYTGGYLVRNIDQVTDYTAYARGLYATY